MLVLLLLVGSIFVFSKLLYNVCVKGSSMEPALYHGDCVLILRYWPSKIFKRDQIVIGSFAKLPYYAASNENSLRLPDENNYIEPLFIKRIVGLPGDTISVNVAEMPDDVRLNHEGDGDYRTWTIPKGHCFLRGDSIGEDSLIWGPVPYSVIDGVVITKLPNMQNAYCNRKLT